MPSSNIRKPSSAKASGTSPVARLNWHDRIARDASLPACALRVAVVLGGYINSDSGTAWPAQERLAGDIGASTDTVQRAISALVAGGYIAIEKGGKFGRSNVYRIVEKAAELRSSHGIDSRKSAVLKAAELRSNRPQNCGTNSSIELKEINSGSKDPLSVGERKSALRADPKKSEPEEINLHRADLFNDTGERHTRTSAGTNGAAGDELFAEFWNAYPKREAKGAARKGWQAAIKSGADPEAIVAGARRYRAERDLVADPAERHRFTKLPATWLRAECWADEPAPTSPSMGGGILLDGVTGDQIVEPPPRPPNRDRGSATDFATAYAAFAFKE